MSTFKNFLENGDMIIVEPSREIYAVHLQAVPVVLVEKTVNCVNRFSSPLPKLTATTSAVVEKQITELDVRNDELAWFKAFCKDPGFTAKIKQANDALFDDKSGSRRITYANTMYYKMKGEWAALPDLWLIGARNPPTVEVQSTNMNEDQHYVRMGFIGYKWKLQKVTLDVKADDPRIIMTIRTGVDQTV
jgi:hypothetical protein